MPETVRRTRTVRGSCTLTAAPFSPVRALRALALGSLLGTLFVLPACREDQPRGSNQIPEEERLNRLSPQEEAAGWVLLFDGTTFAGWRGLGREDIPREHWTITDCCIRKVASGNVPVQADGQPLEGGDLITEQTFRDFELYFEWKISPGGNSGVKYNVSEELSTSHSPPNAALGFEYQVLDDDNHPDALTSETHTAGALYDLLSPAGKTLKPVGGYNASRIVLRGNHGEHWLNGLKILEFDLGTEFMDEKLADSKYAEIPGFADRRAGHIVLQDHGDAAWFRNIKIRVLEDR